MELSWRFMMFDGVSWCLMILIWRFSSFFWNCRKLGISSICGLNTGSVVKLRMQDFWSVIQELGWVVLSACQESQRFRHATLLWLWNYCETNQPRHGGAISFGKMVLTKSFGKLTTSEFCGKTLMLESCALLRHTWAEIVSTLKSEWHEAGVLEDSEASCSHWNSIALLGGPFC